MTAGSTAEKNETSEDFIDETTDEEELSDVGRLEEEAQDEKEEKIIARNTTVAAVKWAIFSIVGKIAKLLS